MSLIDTIWFRLFVVALNAAMFCTRAIGDESIRVVVKQLKPAMQSEKDDDTTFFEGTVKLADERQTLAAPKFVKWSSAKPLAVGLRMKSQLRVDVRFKFLGDADEPRRILVDLKGRDARGEMIHHTWRLASDVRVLREPAPVGRFIPIRDLYSSVWMEVPEYYLLPKMHTLEIGFRELAADERKRFPDEPYETDMTVTYPDAEGRFTISFNNPINKHAPGRLKLDSKKNQVIILLHVKNAEEKLQRTELRQISARPVGGYRVNAQMKPKYFEHSAVLATFVTIQPDHDKWVDDFFREGKAAKYKGMWSADGGPLLKMPWTSDTKGWLAAGE